MEKFMRGKRGSALRQDPRSACITDARALHTTTCHSRVTAMSLLSITPSTEVFSLFLNRPFVTPNRYLSGS